MEFHEKLRITAGILCLFTALFRVIIFFVSLDGAVVYSAFFLDWDEAVGLVEGLAIVLMAFLFTILETGFAFLVYIILGAMVIAARRLNIVIIGCNIITGISIILGIRAIAIYTSQNETNPFLILLLIDYIVIFAACLISYLRFRKEGFASSGA
jgi:hypothetical protein